MKRSIFLVRDENVYGERSIYRLDMPMPENVEKRLLDADTTTWRQLVGIFERAVASYERALEAIRDGELDPEGEISGPYDWGLGDWNDS